MTQCREWYVHGRYILTKMNASCSYPHVQGRTGNPEGLTARVRRKEKRNGVKCTWAGRTAPMACPFLSPFLYFSTGQVRVPFRESRDKKRRCKNVFCYGTVYNGRGRKGGSVLFLISCDMWDTGVTWRVFCNPTVCLAAPSTLFPPSFLLHWLRVNCIRAIALLDPFHV